MPLLTCFAILLLFSMSQSALSHVFNAPVADNVQQGTVLADLRSLLASRLQSTLLNSLSYAFLKTPPNELLFQLDSSSGLIRAGTMLDRDRLCPSMAACQHKLDVGLRGDNYFEKVTVLIDFRDDNDNAPEFPSRHVTLNISESTPVGSELPLQPAYDVDSPLNAIDRYEMTSSSFVGDLPFDLQVKRVEDGTFELRLVITEPLDREKVSTYQVQLVATDAGQPSRSGTSLLDVVVTDVNDNRPVFERPSYEVDVDETASAGGDFVVIQLRATDADSGLNGRVKYSFSRRTESSHGDLFTIDKNSGKIYLTGALDYEQERSLTLEVLAQDEGLNSSPVLARVNVNVRDVNDNAPRVEMTSSGARNQGNQMAWDVNVTEHSSNGTVLGHLSVGDPDTDQGGHVACSMHQQPQSKRVHFKLVEMIAGEYVIVTTSEQVDREMSAQYKLTVTCSDHGQPVLSTSVLIFVNVEDINDQRPVFSQTIYNASVKENSEPLEVVVQVTATDADIKPNSDITYGLVNAEGFAIDEISGVIWTNSSFDRESKDRHELHVIAFNKNAPTTATGNPGTSTATVIVNILDVNDQPPRFTRSNYLMNITENKPPNSTVGRVTANDADSTPHNISYHLDVSDKQQHRSIGHLFYVDRRTGIVKTRQVLDREDHNTYQLTIVARDDVIQSFHDSTVVTINVIDENDNSPVVRFPTLRNDMVYVSSDAPIGSQVTKIEASDADESANARLRYFIAGESRHRMFRVDPETGEVLVNGSLADYDDMGTFRLNLEVRDSGSPSRNASATLFVAVKPAQIVMARAPTSGFMSQLLEAPTSGRQLAVFISVLIGAILVVFASCIAVCFVIRRKRKTQQYDENKRTSENHDYPKPPSDLAPASNTLPQPPPINIAPHSSAGSKFYNVLANSVAEQQPPSTPAASSLCSSSLQGQGRTSSMATASMCLEDDEQWDNLPRPPSLSYCVNTTGYRGLPDSTLLCRRPLPVGPSCQAAPFYHGPTSGISSRAALMDGTSATLGRYETSTPSTMSHLYDRVCGATDVNRPYGNVVTSSVGMGSRMSSVHSQSQQPSHHRRMSSGEQQRPIHIESNLGGVGGDEWMCPTSHKSTFSNWLTKESFQLQQNGYRYRVNENGGHGNAELGDEVTSLAPHNSYGHGNSVARSRLHSDTDTKEGKSVHFNDLSGPTVIAPASTGYGSLRKPLIINCTNTSERYISLG